MCPQNVWVYLNMFFVIWRRTSKNQNGFKISLSNASESNIKIILFRDYIFYTSHSFIHLPTY